MNRDDIPTVPARVEPGLLELAIPEPIEAWTLMDLTDLELTRLDDFDLE